MITNSDTQDKVPILFFLLFFVCVVLEDTMYSLFFTNPLQYIFVGLSAVQIEFFTMGCFFSYKTKQVIIM